MQRRQPLPPEAIALASSRGGIVRRSELLTLGVSRHSATRLANDWTALAVGLYALDGDSWLARVHAGCLLGGDGAAAYGTTALALYGLADEDTEAIHVLACRNSSPVAPWLTLHRDRSGARRVVKLNPSRCALEDAIVDGAAQGTEQEAIALVARALQERRTTPERIIATMQSRVRLKHRRFLTDVISDSAEGSHSVLEHRYLNDVERAHGLPPAIRQYRVTETGCTVDLAYPERRLFLELDGVRWHDAAVDRDRDNLHAAHAYITLRFVWSDVHGRPCHVAHQIARALGIDLLKRCPRCPNHLRSQVGRV